MSKAGRAISELFPDKYRKGVTSVSDRTSGVPKDVEYFSLPVTGFDIMTSDLYKEADIVNLHWVADFLDYTTFFSRNKKPVVWTLHDMAPFSGGLHYSEEYGDMGNDGMPSRRVFSEEEQKLFRENLLRKKQSLLDVDNITIVALTDWLRQKSTESELFSRFPHVKIPNGFNTDTFKYRDKLWARDVFGLPKDKVVVLFVSDSLKNRRKGFAYLLSALKGIGSDGLQLCAIGSMKTDGYGEGFCHLGHINDERLLSVAYAAADVFVIPSLEDNLPNVMIESLLCGTPVVGFPVGGIRETIVDGVNGLLCSEVSADALRQKIELFLRSRDQFDGPTIANAAKEKFDIGIQTAAYLNLYSSILSKQ